MSATPTERPAPPGPAVPLAAWTRTVRPSAIGEMLGLMARPGVISFALGLPAPELFPTDEYAAAADRVLSTDRSSLQYTAPYAPLREQIAEVMAWRGVKCRPEQVFVTTAAQQGLSLLSRILLDPGGPVLCERMIYSGFQQAIEPLSPRILAVPTQGESGIDVDAVEEILERGERPAFVYVITEGHNPLGVSVSAEKRRRLVELAHRYGVPLVEDDAYGLLHYGGHPVPPMRALDDRLVFSVGSFSKVMAPGFRVGWVVVPEALVPLLGSAKDGADINTSTFSQRVVSAYLEMGRFPAHLAAARGAYRERRDVLIAALERHFGAGARWHVPQSGALLWLELPEGTDTTARLRAAVQEENVAYVPGEVFAADRSRAGSHCMRLNFSRSSPAEIAEGIARLARVFAPDLAAARQGAEARRAPVAA